MQGGEAFEPEEANPMLGYRGAYRYVREPDLFRLELEAFRKVREEQGLKNLVLMLPFVRTLSDLRACRRLMDEVGLTDVSDFPLWVMACTINSIRSRPTPSTAACATFSANSGWARLT